MGMSEQELTGEVVKVEGKTVYLKQEQGAVVPLRIDQSTQFEEGWRSAKDIKEGQQVRASFQIKNQTSNVAKKIGPSMETGQGGSGLDTMGDTEPPTMPEREPVPSDPSQPSQPLPEDQGSQPSDEPIY